MAIPGFYLSTRSYPYATLAAASAAAEPAAVIEVRGNGPFTSVGLQLVDKPLTIRAAAGSRPVIESPGGAETPDRSFIETDSDLTLEGLEIRWHSIERRLRDNETEEIVPHTALAIRGGMLRMSNCRLSVVAGNCAVGLYGGSCRIVDSMLESPSGPAMVVHMGPKVEVVVENSILRGRSGIVPWLDDDSKGGGKTTVRLSRVTIAATAAYQCFATGTTAAELPTSDTPRLHCEGHRCVFDSRNFVVVRPAAVPAGSPMRPLRNLGRMTNLGDWIGEENVYSGVENFLVALRHGRAPFRMTPTLEDWRARTSTDQTSIAATAQFATTGERREPADFAVVAVPGLKTEEVEKRGAKVEKVAAGNPGARLRSDN